MAGWEDLVFDGLVGALTGSMIGGAIAGLVAYKTVDWTQKGDRAAAVAAIAERAAESLVRATTLAIREIAPALIDHNALGVRLLDTWAVEMEVQRPFLEGTRAWAWVERFHRGAEQMLTLATVAWESERDAFNAGNVTYDPVTGEADVPMAYSHNSWRREARVELELLAWRAIAELQQLRGVPEQTKSSRDPELPDQLITDGAVDAVRREFRQPPA
ncbi:hypothetical protein [Blastococcus litoris]|uniref:hypothetical protein n=1 Tax=Blastococcus litoris TaxID=2171622 RepID=UPI000E304747|nr:hypothetical protein [Blastococcus litoris]